MFLQGCQHHRCPFLTGYKAASLSTPSLDAGALARAPSPPPPYEAPPPACADRPPDAADVQAPLFSGTAPALPVPPVLLSLSPAVSAGEPEDSTKFKRQINLKGFVLQQQLLLCDVIRTNPHIYCNIVYVPWLWRAARQQVAATPGCAEPAAASALPWRSSSAASFAPLPVVASFS